ncbi:organelle RRM domain-containing protein 2, mitochondrial-like isoform X1 [Phoenix dactylifera]|uniref:Organelle RRM domain-containing protein 2, mitochondrial-like isoform X1 n=1 Tax=Phoenix dactylifera TaxID=42345 RepID=A0A8B9AWL3_PHODC|nr:organelle RRM domain-containing protein 2, mitochondrial-like isoform X1 [Phoenix dactylifera]
MAAVRAGFRRLFSISAFSPPLPAAAASAAEPSSNLFVSGLSKRTTSEGLNEAFSKFGQVVQGICFFLRTSMRDPIHKMLTVIYVHITARVVTDRVSGYSKGFGFVRYTTVEEAAEGIKGMDGKFLDGWVIFAEYARPRPPPQGPPQP